MGRSKAKRPEVGVVFPEGPKGDRSTTAAGKAVLAAGLRAIDEDDLAGKVTGEKNWRHKYNKYYMKMVEASAEAPGRAIACAEAALAYAHENFQFIPEEGAQSVSLNVAMSNIKGSFETGEVEGTAQATKFLNVPYKPWILRKEALKYQLRTWAKRGTMEPDAAEAISLVISNPKKYIENLKYQYFILIGAGSAMGPFEKLLELGANVIAIDIPGREKLWERLITFARNSAGRLYFPLSKPQSEISSDAELFASAGCNLLTQPAEILNWLRQLSDGPLKGQSVTIGNYTYLDGGLHVKLSIAADAIIKGLCEERKDLKLAFLCTPTDIHAIPSGANKQAQKENAFHIGKPIESLVNVLSGGSQLRPNALKPMAHSMHRVDGMSVAQGPNYALAKRMQHWRAMIAYEKGHWVSANVAPSTATLSVVHNRQFAWAYNGMPYFKPFEIFQQQTTNALMAALLIHDVQNSEGPKNPQNRERYGVESTLQLFSLQSLHGGLWRAAYKVDSIGFTSVLINFLGGPKGFLPVVYGLMAAPLFAYAYYSMAAEGTE